VYPAIFKEVVGVRAKEERVLAATLPELYQQTTDLECLAIADIIKGLLCCLRFLIYYERYI